MTKSNLDDKLRKILENFGEDYFPSDEYPPSYAPQNKEAIERTIPELKQAFADEVMPSVDKRKYKL